MIDWDKLVLAPCEAVFGEAAIYITNDGRSVCTRGVFNDRFADMKFENDQEVHTTHPMISVRASQLPKLPVQSELFHVRQALYMITEVEPDGMGDLRIHLRAANNDEARRASLVRT